MKLKNVMLLRYGSGPFTVIIRYFVVFITEFPSHTEQKLNFINITAKMVSHAIYYLDGTQATDPDIIPAIVLKVCSPEFSPVFAKLHKCLAKSCFPSFWESASVVPVFKSDRERFDPGKYHAISLLPIISEIFESFINDILNKHLDINGLSSDLQYGFCAFRSTASILTSQ